MSKDKSEICLFHQVTQHRDNLLPWCDSCGLTAMMTDPRLEQAKAEAAKMPGGVQMPAHMVVFENQSGTEIVCSCGEVFRGQRLGGAFLAPLTSSPTDEWAKHFKAALRR